MAPEGGVAYDVAQDCSGTGVLGLFGAVIIISHKSCFAYELNDFPLSRGDTHIYLSLEVIHQTQMRCEKLLMFAGPTMQEPFPVETRLLETHLVKAAGRYVNAWVRKDESDTNLLATNIFQIFHAFQRFVRHVQITMTRLEVLDMSDVVARRGVEVCYVRRNRPRSWENWRLRLE